jgi:hypothetical protein
VLIIFTKFHTIQYNLKQKTTVTMTEHCAVGALLCTFTMRTENTSSETTGTECAMV